MLGPNLSVAGPVYSELGFGIGKMQNPQALYGSEQGLSTGLGMGLNLALGWNLANDNSSALQLHLGFKSRAISASNSEATLTFIDVGPFFRIETYRFYIGAGAAPLLWKSSGEAGGMLIVSRKESTGALGYHGEFGLLWRVVPDFSLALEASYGMISYQSSFGPKPDLIGSFQMRFELFKGSKSSGGNKKVDGWRYPFGIPVGPKRN